MRNIPFSPPDIREEDIQEVVDALRSGWITTGPRTKTFEAKIAEYCETNRAVCLNSATAAEELNFIKLYSWPTSCIELPHDFNRIFAKDVFYAVKTALEPIGYQFVKE